MDGEKQTNRAHRAPKVAKKLPDRGQNPKAFAPASFRRAEKQARRNVEKDQTRLHVPLVDRTFGGTAGQGGKDVDDVPPVIVAVMGPAGVGKSTLVRSLVRRFTKNTMADIKGPVTVVSGKNRRLTIIECPNDLGSMIDTAKVADLVLLMIDGSFGFEMETFEALSALSSHGLPKIIAILTHLDLVKTPAALKAQKKRLKNRFWTEVYDGAKMFYLSGVMNGRYPDREILNLSRFISVAKFRPLVFRNTHSYFLADRFEDLTPRELLRTTPKTDRTIALFGYLRGVPLRPPSSSHSVRVHIPGSGTDAFEVGRMMEGYKERKEAFVSGSTGGSVTHINLVCLTALTTYALWTVLAPRLAARSGPAWTIAAAEFGILVVPLLFSLTALSAYSFSLNAFLALLVFVLRQDSSTTSPPTLGTPTLPHPLLSPSLKEFRPVVIPPRLFDRPFVTVYRAHMMLMTVICILAVDFRVFPREFAKAETWGTSVMDLGVGSFVFAQGMVSALPLLRSRDRKPFLAAVWDSTKKSAAVLALGVVRVLMVKGVDYPEHVSEYGVHWNFFFTLGLLPVFGAALERLSPFLDYSWMALVITGLHQLALNATSLQYWTLTAERTTFLAQNKEGLVSLPGYVAIYLFGIAAGLYVLPPDPYFFQRLQPEAGALSKEKQRLADAKMEKAWKPKPGKLASVLGSYAIVWWGAYGLLRLGDWHVSRRLANLPYVIWTVAFNTSFLFGYLGIHMWASSGDSLLSGSTAPAIFEAINRNGLVVFLVANVLTGLVNVSISSIDASDTVAMLVMLLYCATVYGVAWPKERLQERERAARANALHPSHSTNSNAKRPLQVVPADSTSPTAPNARTVPSRTSVRTAQAGAALQNAVASGSGSGTGHFKRGEGTTAPLRSQISGKSYIEYDLATLKNSRGGFLLENEEDDPRKIKERQLMEENKLKRLENARKQGTSMSGSSATDSKCAHCGSRDLDDQFLAVFGVRVCSKCKAERPDEYSLLTKTECKEDYLLTDPELKDEELLPHLLRPNPHRPTYSNMMLFLRMQVETFAFSDKKWGSAEALDAEFERREAEKKEKKSKKFDKKLRELRRKTKTNVWHKRIEGEHRHDYGDGTVVNDAGEDVQRCAECGFEVEVEVF